VTHPEIQRDSFGAHWTSPNADLPNTTRHSERIRRETICRNAVRASAGYDPLEQLELPVIVESGSLNWRPDDARWTPALILTFGPETSALFPSPPGSLQGTRYGEAYPFHCTASRASTWLDQVKARLEEASASGRFTLRLQKGSTGLAKTSYNIVGGSLGTLLLSDPLFADEPAGIKLDWKPWHVSL